MEQSVQSQPVFAAIDLGSNSFHMVLARIINDQIQIIDKRGEKVQLAAGLHPTEGIAPDAQERALACLERFGESLRGLSRQQVAVYGTNTLRAAANSKAFMQKANGVLGFPIEVISGVEEARLVYLGVAHTLADDDGRRLVVDIGGGSTEFIIGERFKPIKLESLHMGCVTYSDRYFPGGEITEQGFDKAVSAARNALMAIKSQYKKLGWANVVGSSGTIRASLRVMQNYGLIEDEISEGGLIRLRKLILQSKHVSELNLQGLSGQRQKVFPAGVAILTAVFKELGIMNMVYSDGALREGALYDLLGRVKHEDVRETTVNNMQTRFVVDVAQAEAVKASVVSLYEQAASKWKLTERDNQDLLRWAADLHEVGLAIAHSQYYKHSAYLVQHSDMFGFTKPVQDRLSIMLRYQRRKPLFAEMEEWSKKGRQNVIRLTLLLRLAILLNHTRDPDDSVFPDLVVSKQQMTLTFPQRYLEDRPMTVMNLEMEQQLLQEAGYELQFS